MHLTVGLHVGGQRSAAERIPAVAPRTVVDGENTPTFPCVYEPRETMENEQMVLSTHYLTFYISNSRPPIPSVHCTFRPPARPSSIHLVPPPLCAIVRIRLQCSDFQFTRALSASLFTVRHSGCGVRARSRRGFAPSAYTLLVDS